MSQNLCHVYDFSLCTALYRPHCTCFISVTPSTGRRTAVDTVSYQLGLAHLFSRRFPFSQFPCPVSFNAPSTAVPSLLTDPASVSHLSERTQFHRSVSSHRPSSVAPPPLMVPVQCPGHLSRLITFGPVGPSTVFPRCRNSSVTDEWKFRGISTSVCETAVVATCEISFFFLKHIIKT